MPGAAAPPQPGRSLSAADEIEAAVHHLCAADPLLLPLLTAHRRPSFPSSTTATTHFHPLARSILYHNLSFPASTTSYSRLLSLLGGPDRFLPGAVLVLTPTSSAAQASLARKASTCVPSRPCSVTGPSPTLRSPPWTTLPSSACSPPPSGALACPHVHDIRPPPPRRAPDLRPWPAKGGPTDAWVGGAARAVGSGAALRAVAALSSALGIFDASPRPRKLRRHDNDGEPYHTIPPFSLLPVTTTTSCLLPLSVLPMLVA